MLTAKHVRLVHLPSVMDDLGNQASPAALVRCSKAPSGITVKEFVEPHVIFPVLIEVEKVRVVVYRSTSFIVTGKQML